MKKKEAKCVHSLILPFDRSMFSLGPLHRYLQIFTPLEPTVHEITQYHFEKVPSKTRELRPDTLSNMLAMANVRPGGRLLVVENIGGLIVAAAVERMGGSSHFRFFSPQILAHLDFTLTGKGRILVINDADSPPDLHLVDSFNFSSEDLAPVTSIHWAATDEDWTPPELPLELKEDQDGVKRNSRETQKLKKRKATFDKSREAREEYFKGEFDGSVASSPVLFILEDETHLSHFTA